MTAPLPPVPWVAHPHSRTGEPFGALFWIAEREYALLLPRPADATALFARLGIDPAGAAWRAYPGALFVLVPADERDTLTGEFVRKSWVAVAPGPRQRRAPLADLADALLVRDPARLEQWLIACLDIYAQRAALCPRPAVPGAADRN